MDLGGTRASLVGDVITITKNRMSQPIRSREALLHSNGLATVGAATREKAQLFELAPHFSEASFPPRVQIVCAFVCATKPIFFSLHTFSPSSKMREIVHLQAGQCGNQIGAKVRFLKIFFYSLPAHVCSYATVRALFYVNYLLF